MKISRQVRRQHARLTAKAKRYTKRHRKFLLEQGPSYVPTRPGRPKLEWVANGLQMIKVVTGWISPKEYPRQSKRQAARYASQTV